VTEVEALLSADAGRPPPGTVVFRARDPEAPARRVRFGLGLALAATAVACAFGGAAVELVALLGLGAALLVVLATPTAPPPDEARVKQPTLLITPTGMIVRDDSGLRCWRFDEVSDIRPYLLDRRLGILVTGVDGSRHFVDSLAYERGEDLGVIIGRHLRPRGT
jgi:hypothetical protein